MSARRALLADLIDHAALFPPASLEMDAALEVDRLARETPEAWILHRFLVPASHLAEIPDGFAPPLGVIVDVDELPDLTRCNVEVVEARLERAALAAGTPGRLFLEVWPGDGEKLDEVAALGACAKVRCGGAMPDMYPSPAQLAAFVVGCRDRGLAFKATAGLHHPIRDGIVHGFLNLLGASVLAHADGATEADLTAVLLEEDYNAFTLDDEAFGVRGKRFGADAVAAARAELFTGYGSCSFSEPVDDLRSLGLL